MLHTTADAVAHAATPPLLTPVGRQLVEQHPQFGGGFGVVPQRPSHPVAPLGLHIGGGVRVLGVPRGDQLLARLVEFTGDGQIVARVASVQNTNGLAKAGVMFREDLTPGSRHVNLSVSPDGWTRMVSRQRTNDDSTSDSRNGAAAPYWIKLVRAGNTFTGYRSPNGVDWTLIGEDTFFSSAVPRTLYVGLAESNLGGALSALETTVLLTVDETIEALGRILEDAVVEALEGEVGS